MRKDPPKIAVANHKGGVGKTTITANLALSLARGGKRVLIVDIDPQAHSTSYFIGATTEEDYERSLGPLYEKIVDNDRIEPRDVVSILATPPSPKITRLWLLPSHLKIARLEGKLIGAGLARTFGIRRILSALLEAEPFDLIFLDCPPNLGVLTEMALVAADYLLIPVEPSSPSITAVTDILAYLRGMEGSANIPGLAPVPLGIVFNRFKQGTIHDSQVRDIISEIAEEHGVRLFQTIIPDSVKMREVFYQGVGIEDYSPNSRVAQAFSSLKAEFLDALEVEERKAAERKGVGV